MSPLETNVIVRIRADQTPPPIASVASEAVVIERLVDEVIDTLGQHVTSRYCEVFWLPIIGPSALWLLRHASYHTEHGPYAVEVEVLGKCLGLGGAFSANSSLHRTFDRLKHFNCADGGWAETWRLRTHLPPLARRHLARLPETLQHAHAELVGAKS